MLSVGIFHSAIETFELKVEAGTFTDSEIIVMLGENGMFLWVAGQRLTTMLLCYVMGGR